MQTVVHGERVSPHYLVHAGTAEPLRVSPPEAVAYLLELKMIVFLGWGNGQRTNNHVERNNRVFRMMQKTRYKRRKPHTMEKALELELYARMVEHPLYRHNVGELRIPCRENSSLQMVA